MSKKGITQRRWTKDEKIKLVRLHLEEHMSVCQIEREYGVNNSLVSAWVQKYLEDGEEALEPRSGNPYAALHFTGLLEKAHTAHPSYGYHRLAGAVFNETGWVFSHRNATAPLKIVVSDMTMFRVGRTYWEWTLLLDTFNNEILAVFTP